VIATGAALVEVINPYGMEYHEYPLASGLVPFMDCYWTLRAGNAAGTVTRRIIPDSCAAMILNLGEEIQGWNGRHRRLKHESACLAGTRQKSSTGLRI
jgi:hypothetical protein